MTPPETSETPGETIWRIHHSRRIPLSRSSATMRARPLFKPSTRCRIGAPSLPNMSEKNSNAVFDKMADAAKVARLADGFRRTQPQADAKRVQAAAPGRRSGHGRLGEAGEIDRNAGTVSELPEFPRLSAARLVFRNFTGARPAACSPACRTLERAPRTRSNSGCRPPRCGRRAGSRPCPPGWMPSRTRWARRRLIR